MANRVKSAAILMFCGFAGSICAEDPPVVKPLLLDPVEDRYSTQVGKAEADFQKVKKTAGDARVKAYKDRLTEVTKAGDFDKAVALKARLVELEKDSEVEGVKAKRPRPKETVKFDKHSYALIRESVTWNVAKRRCEEMGGNLVCLETAREAEFISQLCGTNTAWLGASNEEGEHEWRWVSGTPLQPSDAWVLNDSKTEPQKACGLTYWSNKQFDDVALNLRLSYVCEWDR